MAMTTSHDLGSQQDRCVSSEGYFHIGGIWSLTLDLSLPVKLQWVHPNRTLDEHVQLNCIFF